MISIDAKEIEKAKSLLKNYPQQVIAAAASNKSYVCNGKD